jgi:peptidoglycan/xylan/chitin deacetylase (PgdA/CDA1 family)
VTRLASLTLHAEKLHRDDVWAAVERLAQRAAGLGARLTFFVHPFWALAAGADIATRVVRLAELGHEIGQHTHYYDARTGRVPGHKAGDLDPGNVVRRLEEDRAALERAGVPPRGFVSGAWAFPEGLAEWLAGHGFTYDCSLRTYAPPSNASGMTPAAAPHFLRDGLLEVPTTAPLRRAIGLLPGSARLGDLAYRLVYCHDDDLLDLRKRAALGYLLAILPFRGWRLVSAGEIAQCCREELMRHG